MDFRRRLGRLARLGRVPTAEHRGGKQWRAEGNDSGQGAGHLRAGIRGRRAQRGHAPPQQCEQQAKHHPQQAVGKNDRDCRRQQQGGKAQRDPHHQQGERAAAKAPGPDAGDGQKEQPTSGVDCRAADHDHARGPLGRVDGKLRPSGRFRCRARAGRAVFRPSPGQRRFPVFAAQGIEDRLVSTALQPAQQAAAEAERRGPRDLRILVVAAGGIARRQFQPPVPREDRQSDIRQRRPQPVENSQRLPAGRNLQDQCDVVQVGAQIDGQLARGWTGSADGRYRLVVYFRLGRS